MLVRMITTVKNKRHGSSILHMQNLPKMAADKLVRQKLATKNSRTGLYALNSKGRTKIINELSSKEQIKQREAVKKQCFLDKRNDIQFSMFGLAFVSSLCATIILKSIPDMLALTNSTSGSIIFLSIIASGAILGGFIGFKLGCHGEKVPANGKTFKKII